MSANEWYVVVERTSLGGEEMPPYVLGPMDEAQVEREMEDEDTITFCLVTIDAKNEGYIAGDCYATTEPPEGERIIP